VTHDEYISRDATALARLVRGGDVTPRELLAIALERIEALNPSLNAVVRLMEADARRAAARPPSGPFAGVPFLAKDLITTYAGHPTSAGTRVLAHHVVDHDSELARRVRATGVSVVGKTNVPEWGITPFTEPELWGPCRNPSISIGCSTRCGTGRYSMRNAPVSCRPSTEARLSRIAGVAFFTTPKGFTPVPQAYPQNLWKTR